MKRSKKGNRILAVMLSILLAFGGLPTAAFAEEQPCEH